MKLHVKVLIMGGMLLGGLRPAGAEGLDPATLNAAGKQAYEKHHRFFTGIVPRFQVETKRQVNAGYRALTRLMFFTGPASVDGRLPIEVPFELNEYVFDFRTLEIHGSGLKGVSRIFVDGGDGGNSVVVITAQQDRLITVRVSSFMAAMERPFSIVLEGSGTVEKMELVNTEGIAFEFDPSVYMEPGIDRPVLPVTATVDATRYRAIDGICDLDRSRYFRYYAEPNADRSGRESYIKGKGFLPGRQILEIGPAYEDRWGAADRMPHLTEDPQRKGYSDPAFFERREFYRYEGVDPSLDFIMCFDTWPRFMWPTNLPGVPNQRGTPAAEHFDAAADTVVRLLNAQIRDSGRTATWWEVKNECDVKSEWIYHHQPGYDGWQLLADFHNTVADAVHSNVPDVLIGGPASAWFQPHRSGFAVWDRHRQFMDRTRDHLDFYSLHFYVTGSMDSMAAWRNGVDCYIQGGLECTLDMLQAHMEASGNRKPLVCSEYGSLPVKREERGWWLHLKNINALLVHFLNRPDDIEIAVPFMLSFMHWAPDSSETFIHQSPSGEFVKTKNTYLLDMWEGFEGRRIPVSDSAAKVFTFAVLDGDRVRLVVNNSTGRRVSLDVDALLPAEGKVASVKRRTVVFAQGETRYLHDRLPGLQAVPLRVDETCILEIALDREPVPETRINEVAYYAPQTAVKLGDSAAFDIEVPAAGAAGAMLRVGLHRSGGFSKPVFVEFNGETHTVDLGWSSGIPHFLDFVEIPVRPEQLKMLNRVVVRAEEHDATVTAVKLVLSVEEKSEPVPKDSDE